MSLRIAEFDLWRARYAGATVYVKKASDDADASIYYDEDLADAAGNPQVLLSYTQGGISYGKFARPLYVGEAYYLITNSVDRTGAVRVPLESLDDVDASNAVVTAAGGSESRSLEDRAADVVLVVDQGEFLPASDPDASASTNDETLEAAIGVASDNGGGYPVIPSGTYAAVSFSLPANVVLRGQSEEGSNLQSVLGSEVVTVSGEKGGLEDMTLDGVSNQTSSVGVYSKAVDLVRMRRATIQNFYTGMQIQGGNKAQLEDFTVDSCVYGVLMHGDDDATGGADGDDCQHNTWRGGIVSNCTLAGVQLKYVDRPCWYNHFYDVGFESNSGTALDVVGARFTELDNCWFTGSAGTTAISIADGSDTTHADENTVVGFHMRGGVIDGDMDFTGKCQDVVFDGVHFKSGTYTLTDVKNNIVCIDCIEDADVEIAGGDATKWTRCRRQLGDAPGSTGVTTDATSTEAWSYNLAPGERVNLEAVVIANGRNVIDYATYHIAQSAHRTGSTLAYDAQTANFTTGEVLTGTTSGATARITADSDSGATGTLTLRDIVGEFIDNEAITDAEGGAAVANGVMAHQNATLLGSITSLETAIESDATWACIFGVTSDEVRVMVTGAASKTVEWTVSVKVTSG